MIQIFLQAILCCLTIPVLRAQAFYDVTGFGARNDSTQIATRPIAAAIEAASRAGGGTVYFPAGRYHTGPIHLKSNITIFIDAGAELHFSDDFDQYLPMVESRYEGVDVVSFSPLFYANGAENITITGRGRIDGHGRKWWDFTEGYREGQPRSRWQKIFDSLNRDILLPDDPKQMKRGFLRPPLIQTMHCSNVRIEGITIVNSPFWTVNPEFCDNVLITGVTIVNPPSPNTDGINPGSCRNVRISDCHISVGDDCITIKSGKDIPGRTKARPAENYTITNCTMLNGHGAVVIGSEMSGGVRNIVISNCIFDGTDRGIRIKTTRGRGGVVEDLRVDNIIMKNIREQAIVLDMEYSKAPLEPVSERTPRFRNIRFSNITAQGREAMFVNGLDEMPVSGISLHDVIFDTEEGIRIRNAQEVDLHHVRVNARKGVLLTVENTERLLVDALSTSDASDTVPLIRLKDARDVMIANTWLLQRVKTFSMVSGKRTQNINFNNNAIGAASTHVGRDVPSGAVKVGRR